MNCIFCKIINKEIPSTIEYEDDEIIAFDDINPEAPVHILVIPKKHIESLAAMEESDVVLISKMMSVIKKLAIEKGIDKTGYRVITNSGKDSGQLVEHLHFHLIGGKKLGTKVVEN